MTNVNLGAAAVDAFIDARHGVVADVALFCALESNERVAEFLLFLHGKLDGLLVVMAPSDRTFFIRRLIDDVLIRTNEIERDAVRGSRSLN